jgi:hypothetical protein
MPKYIVFVHASAESEAGKIPTTEELKEMSSFNQELVDAGIMIAGEGLLSSSKGTRLKYSTDSSPTLQKGPFDLVNLVAGYWVWKLDSMEDAIEWAKKIPLKEGSVDIRKIAGPEDFGEVFTDELKDKEEEMRKAVEAGSKN